MRKYVPSTLSNPNYGYRGYHDGRMVRGFLYNIEQDARRLQEVLTDDDDLPQWVSWKIYTAEDRLQAATRYMEREAALQRSRSKSNPEAEEFYEPTNMVAVAAFLLAFGWLVNSRVRSRP